MNGMRERELGATQVLHEKLTSSRVGRRWERILRYHASELEALMLVHPDLRDHVGDALCALASHWSDGAVGAVGAAPLTPAQRGSATIDSATEQCVSRVLDDLQRLGGLELQRDVTGLREELAMARGRSLDDVLAG